MCGTSALIAIRASLEFRPYPRIQPGLILSGNGGDSSPLTASVEILTLADPAPCNPAGCLWRQCHDERV
jgi:hypothetical protein